MGKKHRIVLVVLALAVLGGVVGVWLMRPTEPVYLGKPLSAWLAEYNGVKGFAWPDNLGITASDAVRHIGTNSFPMIAYRLRYKDSALKVKLFQFIQRHPQLHLPLPALKQNAYNFQAVLALNALDQKAKPLAPTLAEALGHLDSGTRYMAEFWLRSLGSDGGVAVPALIEMVKNKKEKSRFNLVITLATVGSKQTNVVLPVLERCLTDADPMVRSDATNVFLAEPWLGLNSNYQSDSTKRIQAVLTAPTTDWIPQ